MSLAGPHDFPGGILTTLTVSDVFAVSISINLIRNGIVACPRNTNADDPRPLLDASFMLRRVLARTEVLLPVSHLLVALSVAATESNGERMW